MTEREFEILKIIEQDPLISQNELADALNITRSGAAAHIHNLMKKGYIKGKGYVLSEPRFVTVVGGVNIDIMGISRDKIIQDNSNPGRIRYLLGGAGRNIALALTKLEVPNYFISVFGDDLNGEKFAADSRAHNMDIQFCERISGAATSSFLYIEDCDGSSVAGIDDMDIYKSMTPAFIEKNLQKINSSEFCIIDTNLPRETIDFICEKVTAPLVVKTVSLNKSNRFVHNLDKIKILITSHNELAQLVKERNESYTDSGAAADFLLRQGLEHIVVFSAQNGLLHKSSNGGDCFKRNRQPVVNPTGAGSTLTGALVWGLQNSMKFEDALKYAYSAACMTMEVPESVSPELSYTNMLEKKKQIFPDEKQ